MTGLPRFEEVARLRPVDLVAPDAVDLALDGPGSGRLRSPAPYVAVVADLRGAADAGGGPGDTVEARVTLRAGDLAVSAVLDDGRTALAVTLPDGESVHRSRRHGRARRPIDALALSLTGALATLFTRDSGGWTARARADLTDHDVNPYDPERLAGLEASGEGAVARLTAGGFGQLGLRDIRLVTEVDGTPHRPAGLPATSVLLTATSAGPGFFGTAHASVWELDTEGLVLRHRSDLFFRRGGSVYGDHAIHLVRAPQGAAGTGHAGPTGPAWLVATSTWGDFLDPAIDHVHAQLGITSADLLAGRHVVDTEPLRLPTDGLGSAGVWDPHLVQAPTGPDGASEWLVGYVSARRYFDFHPVLASGPSLDALRLRGAVTDRRATEGTTVVRVGDRWRVLASDGRDNRRRHRAAYPVFDLDLRQLGTIEAPYPTNLPWPTLVPGTATGGSARGSLLVGFDGAPVGGRLTGYGTHGAVVIAREVRD